MRFLLVIFSFFISSAAIAETVQLEGFAIDRTEVTVGAFSAYMESKALRTAAEEQGGGFEWGLGWQRRAGWTYQAPQGAPAKADEPAVHISWAEADGFCKAAGGRLPNKEEWLAAAYTEQRSNPPQGFETGRSYLYPVGDQPDGMNNNRSHHVAVGTTKQGVNGLYDMGGNVWEWLADRKGDEALTAGGSWWYGPQKTTASGMQWKPADFYAVYIGFRCVYSPQ